MNKKGCDGEFGWGVLVTLLFILAIVAVWTIVSAITGDSNEIEISDDELVSKYVISFYPEYENCTIEYGDVCRNCFNFVSGAKVYCDENPENRDGLKIKRGEPTIKIEFKDISLEEIENYYKIKLELK